MTPDSPQGVTEVGEFLARIASAIPEKTRDELVRLLGHSVAMPTMPELREARLGLLTSMMSQGTIPTSTEYNNARQNESEDWPSHAALVIQYGTWARAATAAMDLCYGMSKHRDKARSPHPWLPKPYERPEILRALDWCSEKVGRPITQWEYVELRRVERRLAVIQGRPDPRLPGIGVIRGNFGTWDSASRLNGMS